MSPYRPALLTLAAFAVLLAACEPTSTVDPDAAAAQVQPVARIEFQRAPAVATGERTGEEIYGKICTVCHATGTLGAPVTGDHAAWAPRIATGFDALVQSVINGKGNMAPRSGSPDLTDAEVRRAVVYLANLGGADFSETPVEATPDAADESAPESTDEAASGLPSDPASGTAPESTDDPASTLFRTPLETGVEPVPE